MKKIGSLILVVLCSTLVGCRSEKPISSITTPISTVMWMSEDYGWLFKKPYPPAAGKYSIELRYLLENRLFHDKT